MSERMTAQPENTKAIKSKFYQLLIQELKDVRKTAGETQETLAAKMGRDQSWVSKVEGVELTLDIAELRDYCLAVKIDLLHLLDVVSLKYRNIEAGGKGELTMKDKPFNFGFPKVDKEWTESDWKNLLSILVLNGMVTYKEISSLVLGHLNPSQVGTSVASKKTFQKHYAKGKTWEAVRKWHFELSGKCADCGTRLELQADHIIPRETDKANADRLDNLTLRCRRCNVVKRPSHKKGGLTYLTAEAALMWILFSRTPKTYQEFEKMCREYGLTMANIRFQEAWAMARWLNSLGLYDIDEGSKY